jgi:hypothetical protein
VDPTNYLRTARRPLVGTIAALSLVAGATLAVAPAATAAPTAPGVVSSGNGWTVTRAAGGYTVALSLASPLPVKDDIPELVVDGVDLGPATESPDGKKLSITTADPTAASVSSVSWQWSSGGSSTATGPTTLPKAPLTPQSAIAKPADVGGSGDTADDPTTIGTGAYTIADYNFGAQSIALADIGGIRGELEGRIYLPTDGKPHPLVIFEHGRHSSCYNTTTLKGASGWPCPAGTAPILSYAGYDGAGKALAADGYTVVSISANAINANDNQLSPDDGAITRGQLILDTLTMLKHANAGDPISYHDAATNQDVTLDQALAAGQLTYPTPPTTLSAANLVGTMDFSKIGIMGHSRGGEGAVTAGTLNEGLADPWNIKSIFALAPIDFTRPTLPDVITTTLLPYCDGDVSDQQGQHFYADSRNAFSDNVQRSDIWVMGTDHDFYNTSWTPPYPGASDDWSASSDAVCGTNDTALASGTNIRLTAAQQYQTGSAYLAGFFELTLGGATQFQGMFDGSQLEPPSVSAFADVRTVAQQPANSRSDITDFASTSPLIGTSSTATAVVCANKYGRTVPEPVPSCTSPTVGLTSQQQPYWTPASFAPNVPLNPMTHLTWTAATGSLGVTVPAAKRDVSGFSEMTVLMSPDDSVVTGTDMTLSVTDGSGVTWSAPVSSLNKWGVTRMPASTSTNLDKIVLQQVRVPTATLAAAGLDLTHIAKVTFTAATGADATATGGVYLSDLTFDSPALGTPSVQTRPTVNVNPTTAEEGSGPGTDKVAVYLSQPSSSKITTYLTVVGSAVGKVGVALQKVTFAPGETCQSVEIPSAGDTAAGTAATSSFKLAVSDSTNAVLGLHDFGTITVREDDGVTGTATAAPPVGVQGDVCAEYAALSTPGTLTSSSAQPAPGSAVTLTGSGYRNGESVAFTIGSVALGSAIAGTDGTVTLTAPIPGDQAFGPATVTAVGAGSGYTETVGLDVLATTTTTLTIDPAAPAIDQAATLTATVAGVGSEGGPVTFRDGATVLGTATVSGGSATHAVPAGFKAGSHALTATFQGTDTSNKSVSNTVEVDLAKEHSAIAVALLHSTYTYGQTVSGIVSVAGATTGTVKLVSGSTTVLAPISASGSGKFTLPGVISVGKHTFTAQYEGTDFVEPSAVTTVGYTVAKAKTATSIAVSATKIVHGKTVKVTFSVAGRVAGSYPGGSVTITARVGSHVRVVRVTLTQAGKGKGSATFPINTKGTATIVAAYGGDANYLSSTSATKKVTVT